MSLLAASGCHFDNTVQILGGIYFRKHKDFRISRDIIVPPLDRFGGHWRPTGVKMYIFVHQGKPCSIQVHLRTLESDK